jgi:hypothetical protein
MTFADLVTLCETHATGQFTHTVTHNVHYITKQNNVLTYIILQHENSKPGTELG